MGPPQLEPDSEALAQLERCVDANLFDLGWLERCPLLAPLRGEPRYAELHARLVRQSLSLARSTPGAASASLLATEPPRRTCTREIELIAALVPNQALRARLGPSSFQGGFRKAPSAHPKRSPHGSY